jgi:protein disulfide-isomerase A1
LQYAKAATELKSHEPKVILAKLDADEEENKALASLYGVQGFPTLKIFREGGENVMFYNGPRDADGIVSSLKQMVAPPSKLLSSLEQANSIVRENPLTVVAVFKDPESKEYKEFLNVADELRSEYNFTHTFDSSYVPDTGVDLSAPAVRLYKNFDEGFSDATDLSPEGLKIFLEEKSVPIVLELNKDPSNHAYLVKIFNGVGPKVFLFLDLKGADADEYRTAYSDLAKASQPKGIKFLIGDAAENENALKHFGIKEDKVPAIVVEGTGTSRQSIGLDIKASELAHWLQDYLDGKLKPYVKSEEIPETNDEPVKVVVRNTLNDMVLESGKNVLLEIYAPWCGHCKRLAPTLEEVAIEFKDDDDVVIAKLDGSTNDIPYEIFEVKGFPTLYLHTAAGENIQYEGDRSKADLIEFVNKNRSNPPKTGAVKDEL